MTEAERRTIAERAGHCCEYCFSQDLLSHDDFAVEHIHPRAEGGTDDLANLAWSCQGCNSRKYTATEAVDPVTGQSVALYNPRQDTWQTHFLWSRDFSLLIGLTPVGRATIVRLDLNRAGIVNLRQALSVAGYHPPNLPLFQEGDT